MCQFFEECDTHTNIYSCSQFLPYVTATVTNTAIHFPPLFSLYVVKSLHLSLFQRTGCHKPPAIALSRGNWSRQRPNRSIVLWKSPQLTLQHLRRQTFLTYKKASNNDVTNTPIPTALFCLQHKHSNVGSRWYTPDHFWASVWHLADLISASRDFWHRTCLCLLPSTLILWFPSVWTH
jgi:hypothetical protein